MVMHEAGWQGDDRLAQDLVELGLTRNEARLYLAAFDRPALRAAELAELARINRTKAYEVLRQLVDKGLFEELPGNGAARFRAVPPELVARRLRQQVIVDQAHLLEETRLLVADLFTHYYAAPRRPDPFDFVELLRNAEAARARREAVVAAARHEVLRSARLPGEAAGIPGTRLRVRFRSLYERSALLDPRAREQLAALREQGTEVRLAERVALDACLVDRRTSVIDLGSRPRQPRATSPVGWVVVEHPGLAALLAGAFEHSWAAARPL